MAYRLPIVDVVRLSPKVSQEELRKFRFNPDHIKRAFEDKVLLFSKPEPTEESISPLITIVCSIKGQFYGGQEASFNASFKAESLVKFVSSKQKVTFVTNEAQIDSEEAYGVRLTSTTQFILSENLNDCFSFPSQPGSWLLEPTIISREYEDLAFQFQPNEVTSALLGCAGSVFRSSSSGRPGGSTSLLLVGPSGSGCTCLVQGLARRYGATYLRLTSNEINIK